VIRIHFLHKAESVVDELILPVRFNARSGHASFSVSRTPSAPTLHRRRGRLLGHEGLLQPTDIEIVEQPTDHVLRDPMRAPVVEFMAGREYEPIIEPVNSCCHAGTYERRSIDHHGTGEPAVRMTIIQPKE
jgi:hypothetical protein